MEPRIPLLPAIRSTAFAVIFYALTVPAVMAAALAGPLGARPLRAVVRGWARFHRLACRWLLGQRVRVEGALPAGAAFIVVKHESMFETIDIMCLLDHPAIIAKQELIDIPGWGTMGKRYGLIGIERDAGARALRQLKRDVASAVASGRTVVLFPEGTRVPHGVHAPLRAGFAALYQLMGLPVLPIAVDSGRIAPRGRFLKRAGTITYRIGELIPPGLPRGEAEARVRDAINALNPPAGDGLSPPA